MTTQARTYALPPPEFGRDGGEFYRHYDKIADQLDNRMVKGLKASLDGLLIFAGLFAAINSGFLALTLPQMSPNPLDDTNTLLSHLLERNGNSPPDLPSKNFSPKPHMPTVNRLLVISLASALIASFFAVAGKQWLANYQALDGSGGDKQRGEQLKRSRSAEYWRLVPILDVVIPLLLQLALIVFAAGIALYLVQLDPALGYTLVGIALLAAILGAGPVAVALWDPYSPYRTPLSRFLKWLAPRLVLGIMWVVVVVARWVEDVTSVSLVSIAGERREPRADVAGQLRRKIFPQYRVEEIPVYFQADFVKHILTISADREAIFQAALNIQLVHDRKAIQRVALDETIAARFRDMFSDMERRGVGSRGLQTPSIEAAGDAVAFGGAHLQLVLYEDPPATKVEWSPESAFQSPEGLAGILVNGGGFSNIELPASCRLMRWIFEAWFGTKSLVQQLTLQTSFNLAPTPLSLQTVGFVAFAISLSNDLPNTPASQSFPVWSLSIFPSIQKLFWKQKMDDDLVGRVSAALHTFTSHWQEDEKPSHQVYIALLKSITNQLQNADRDDEPYLLGIVNKALIILRSAEEELRDTAHGLSTLNLRRVRALRAAAVEVIEGCFARAVWRHQDDHHPTHKHLHRLTMRRALDAMAEYLRTVVAESHTDDPDAVQVAANPNDNLNDVQGEANSIVSVDDLENAEVLQLFRPVMEFVQHATVGWDAPGATASGHLYKTVTRHFMPVYQALEQLIPRAVAPVNTRLIFTEICHKRGINFEDQRLEKERALEEELRKAMIEDPYTPEAIELESIG